MPSPFPGGSIGSLAVHGTVNDLAMSGAEPLYLTAGFILEEGLPLEVLARVARDMAAAARAAGVRIVTGDTKVVERGKGDGIYINTAGVGIVGGPGDGLLDSVISEKIKREKPSVDDYEHVREEVLALVQYSYTEKKAILIGLMKKIVPIFPLSSTQ